MQRLRAQRTLSGPVLKSVLDEVIDKVLLGPGEAIKDVDEDQWRVIAADLWSRLEGVEGFAQLDGFAMDAEGRVLEGARSGENVARLIDEALNTGGWLTSLRRESIRPLSALAADRRAELAGAEPQYPDYGKPRDLDGDGTISAEEEEIAAAKDPERLFEERIRSLDAQIAAQERRSSPMARAARRTLGRPVEPVPGPDELPYVSPEALQAAAAAGGNIAAESLPYAIRRVRQGGGVIEPKGDVEEQAQQIIEMGRDRSCPHFMEAINRLYPGDVEKRRKAAAYYGAFYYNQDLKSQTLNQGLLKGDAQEASGTVEKQFQQEVAGLPGYAVDPEAPAVYDWSAHPIPTEAGAGPSITPTSTRPVPHGYQELLDRGASRAQIEEGDAQAGWARGVPRYAVDPVPYSARGVSMVDPMTPGKIHAQRLRDDPGGYLQGALQPFRTAGAQARDFFMDQWVQTQFGPRPVDPVTGEVIYGRTSPTSPTHPLGIPVTSGGSSGGRRF